MLTTNKNLLREGNHSPPNCYKRGGNGYVKKRIIPNGIGTDGTDRYNGRSADPSS